MATTRQDFEREKDINWEAYMYTLTSQWDVFFKDPVPTVGSLPTTGNTVNDHREVISDGFVRRWNGVAWVLPVIAPSSSDAILTEDGTAQMISAMNPWSPALGTDLFPIARWGLNYSLPLSSIASLIGAITITRVAALALIAGNLVVPWQIYIISDRRSFVTTGSQTDGFSQLGSMVINAWEFQNVAEERIAVQYNLSTDAIMYSDMRGNRVTIPLGFINLSAFLTNVRYGDVNITETEFKDVAYVFSAWAILTNNSLQQNLVTGTGASVTNSFFDKNSFVSAVSGMTITGSFFQNTGWTFTNTTVSQSRGLGSTFSWSTYTVNDSDLVNTTISITAPISLDRMLTNSANISHTWTAGNISDGLINGGSISHGGAGNILLPTISWGWVLTMGASNSGNANRVILFNNSTCTHNSTENRSRVFLQNASNLAHTWPGGGFAATDVSLFNNAAITGNSVDPLVRVTLFGGTALFSTAWTVTDYHSVNSGTFSHSLGTISKLFNDWGAITNSATDITNSHIIGWVLTATWGAVDQVVSIYSSVFCAWTNQSSFFLNGTLNNTAWGTLTHTVVRDSIATTGIWTHRYIDVYGNSTYNKTIWGIGEYIDLGHESSYNDATGNNANHLSAYMGGAIANISGTHNFIDVSFSGLFLHLSSGLFEYVKLYQNAFLTTGGTAVGNYIELNGGSAALTVTMDGTSNINNFFMRTNNTRSFTNCVMNDIVIDRPNISSQFLTWLTQNFKRLVAGYSNFETTVDITGLTTLDFTGLHIYGIVNLTSTNPTESLDTFTNFQANHGVTLRPASGLTLTIVHGVAAWNPRCEGGVNTVLDGTNGDNSTYTDRAGVQYESNQNTY